MEAKSIYVMVDKLGWLQGEIKYRRHYFADHLISKKDTQQILWVYPVSASIKKPGSFKAAITKINENKANISYEKKIVNYALPDLIPARLMQYKTGLANYALRQLKSYLESFSAKKILLFTYPALPYLIDLLSWDQIIYDCSDLWTEPSGGRTAKTFSAKFEKKLIREAENKIAGRSSIIFSSSDYLAIRLKKMHNKNVFVIENGVDSSFFVENGNKIETILDSISKPKLGYVGALRSKIDFKLLLEVCKTKPKWNIILVGPNCLNEKDTFNQLIQLDNLYWIDKVEPEFIPYYIKGLDLGLLPYRELPYNQAVFPLKFYEYLSQGIPIVGCGLPSTQKFIKKGIYLHVKREEFITACKEAFLWTHNQNEFDVKTRIRIAQAACWDNKFSYMSDIIKNNLGVNE